MWKKHDFQSNRTTGTTLALNFPKLAQLCDLQGKSGMPFRSTTSSPSSTFRCNPEINPHIGVLLLKCANGLPHSAVIFQPENC